jgi:diguanylate cyclase (GGDEF)-like protein
VSVGDEPSWLVDKQPWLADKPSWPVDERKNRPIKNVRGDHPLRGACPPNGPYGWTRKAVVSNEGMTRDQLKFRAALSRFAVGAAGLVLMPVLYPRTRAHAWVWGAYLVVAAVEQELIRRGIGGRVRTMLSGVVDTAVITFTVHRLGSVVTPVMSVYFFACFANGLVADVRISIALALVNAVAYDAVVWAEWGRWLPFAPDIPRLAALGTPSLGEALSASVFVTTLVLCATTVVSLLVVALDRREGQLVEANARLEELSQHDPLTELYNRRYLFDRVTAELARVRRGYQLTVVMLDLDRFKRVNDGLGHASGDALLHGIGTTLVRSTRVTDIVGRYGGDEFLLVLTDTDAEHARIVAERVVASIRETGLRFDASYAVTASLGVATADETDTVASLLRRADENAYKAKHAGGDRFVS